MRPWLRPTQASGTYAPNTALWSLGCGSNSSWFQMKDRTPVTAFASYVAGWERG